MANKNIDNLRNIISDYPKLWEWEFSFDKLHTDIKAILPSESLIVLTDKMTLPGIDIGDMVATYKGAKAHYGTRMKLDGTVDITFKEIKGATPGESWLVRKAIMKWLSLVDNFAGDTKETIQNYKTSGKLNMQDETGASFYKVRYFGLKPIEFKDTPLTYLPPSEGIDYPTITVTFSYDYWRDSFDSDFGPE